MCDKLHTFILIKTGTSRFLSDFLKLGGFKGEILQKTFFSKQVTTQNRKMCNKDNWFIMH